MKKTSPRFGVWAPHYGKIIANPELERIVAPFALARDMAVSADRVGFDTILFAQHTVASGGKHNNEVLEPWTACAATAALTENIEIIAAIKPLLYHPVVLAKLALGIEDISQGRFAINFVNAFSKPELVNSGIGFPEHDERYAYGAEWLRIVKALISGETVTHHGPHFDITDYRLKPAGLYRERPRIYAGGESEPARALTAELVDTLLINGRSIEEMLEFIEDILRRPRVGQPVEFGTTGFVVARSTDKEAADYLEEVHRLRGNIDKQLAERKQSQAYDPKARQFNGRFNLDARQSVGPGGSLAPGFVGSYDHVARRIADYYEAGVTTFMLTFYPQVEEQERFAATVIPRVLALTKSRKEKKEVWV